MLTWYTYPIHAEHGMEWLVHFVFGKSSREQQARRQVAKISSEYKELSRRLSACQKLKQQKLRELQTEVGRNLELMPEEMYRHPMVLLLSGRIANLQKHEDLLTSGMQRLDEMRYSIANALTTRQVSTCMLSSADVMSGINLSDVDATISAVEVHMDRLDAGNLEPGEPSDAQRSIVDNMTSAMSMRLLESARPVPVRNLDISDSVPAHAHA